MSKQVTPKASEQAEQLALLKQFIERIHGNWKLDDLLSAIVEGLRAYFKADSCLLYIARDETLTLAASTNPHNQEIGLVKMRFDEGITGWVAAHNHSLMISRAAYKDPRFKSFSSLPEDIYESFLSLPITAHGQVIGVLNIQSKKPTRYTKSKIDFAQTTSRQIGIAIDTARLLEETQALKHALTTRKILEKAKGILMRKHTIDEAEAHRILNRQSMNGRVPIAEVAKAIILNAEMEKSVKNNSRERSTD